MSYSNQLKNQLIQFTPLSAMSSDSTGCFDTLRPFQQQNWARLCLKSLFFIPHINSRFPCKLLELYLHTSPSSIFLWINFAYFWGRFRKTTKELPKIGIRSKVDTWIPFYNANTLWQAIWQEFGYFHSHTWFGSHLKGSKITNQQTDFLKIVPIPCGPLPSKFEKW